MSESTWSEWLRNALAERGWKQADLVRESGGHVKADRVSKWLSGREQPSHKLAAATANALGVPRDEAFKAAGFPELVDQPATEAMLDAAVRAAVAPDGTKSGSVIRLASMLNGYSDSDILQVLRLRAIRRENSPKLNAPVNVVEVDFAKADVGGIEEDAPIEDLPDNLEEAWAGQYAADPAGDDPEDHTP